MLCALPVIPAPVHRALLGGLGRGHPVPAGSTQPLLLLHLL